MADDTLRLELLKQLKALLEGGQAHAGFAQAVERMPFDVQAVVPDHLPYSAWQILEHLRIAQRDILDFSTNAGGAGYKHLDWPAAYWPADPAPLDEQAWDACVAVIVSDREQFLSLLKDGDLVKPFPWGDGQNLLRQALLIADHAAYHLGELIVVRRLLDAWPPQ